MPAKVFCKSRTCSNIPLVNTIRMFIMNSDMLLVTQSLMWNVASVHGILQARILEWVVIPFSRGPSWPRDQTLISYVSSIGRLVLYD